MILASLVAEDDFSSKGDAARIELVKRIASVVGARGNIDELSSLLDLLAADGSPSEYSAGAWWRAAAISGLGQGLPRHRGELGRMTLAKLQSSPPEPLPSRSKSEDNCSSKTNKSLAIRNVESPIVRRPSNCWPISRLPKRHRRSRNCFPTISRSRSKPLASMP